MAHDTSDRNLLFGILAVQMDFIARDALVSAMNAWILAKHKSLGQVLLEQHALTDDTRTLLEALVDKHLSLHGNNPQQSLAAVSSASSLKKDLEKVADADVQASMMHVPASSNSAPDPFATSAPIASKPTAPGSRFRILRPHAKGGLGEVFVAHDEELHREVALKEIQNQHADNLEFRSRFVLEAEITGALEHPGVVPVYGLGTYADGRPFYAMRFIRGDSLQDAIERYHKDERLAQEPGKRLLELRKLLGRFIDVCQAMQYAHDRGVLHRDLKPGNIMLGKYGETLIVDWGLAKSGVRGQGSGLSAGTDAGLPAREAPLQLASAGSSETLAGSAIGTPAFMSPEQAAGRLDQLGPASDVYSLGATLYMLLTGKPSIEGREIGNILKKVQQGDFPRPREIQPLVHPALEAICLKAMALNPADRYASPDELAGDLEHWLADEPVKAWPDPLMAQARRWVRHHQPLVAGASAAALVALIALAIGFVWYENERVHAARSKALADAEVVRRQSLAEEKVRQALDQADKARTELHGTLSRAGGVQELLNDPNRWELLINTARADWQRAKDQSADVANAPLATRLNKMDIDLQRDQLDFDVARQLEKVRLDCAIVSDGKFDYPGAERAYPIVFALADCRITAGAEKVAADRIAKSAIKSQLVAGLDHWGFVAARLDKMELCKSLLKTARLADPDSWRDQVRDPERWRDDAFLVELVKKAQTDRKMFARLSPQVLGLVGSRLPPGPIKLSWLRAAQADHPRDFWINFELATEYGPQNPTLAAGYFRTALVIRPNNAAVYFNLGLTQHNNKDLPEAIAAYDKAVALHPKFAQAWNNLGLAHADSRDIPAAIKAYEQALASDPKHAKAWNNLGNVRRLFKEFPKAIEAYQQALLHDPKSAHAWFNLGMALRDHGDARGAVDAFRKALDRDKDFAEARCNLGLALMDNGEFAAALKELMEGHRLGSARKDWTYDSAAWLSRCQRLLALDLKLSAVLQNPAGNDVSELLELAEMCQKYKRRYADAAELYRRAFLIEPNAASQLVKNHRYLAACSAALASADKIAAPEKERLRKQAHAWLAEDLAARAKQARMNPAAAVQFVADMQSWHRNADLASLRDAKENEKLWTEVASLAKQTRERFTETAYQGQFGAKISEQGHPLPLTAGRTYVIDMESTIFDTLLRLEDEKGKVVAENDDISDANLNSRIVFTPQADGAYRAVASSFEQRGLGAYTIIVREFKSAPD